MKKINVMILAFLFTVLSFVNAKPDHVVRQIPTFEFKSTMAIFELKGVMVEQTATDFAQMVLESDSKRIYVYIASPGGQVSALDSMADTMKSSGKKFACVVKEAYSAAFMFLQYCDNRYILKSGTLMAHEASMRAAGTIKQIRSVLEVLEKILMRIEVDVAHRLGMAQHEYKLRIAYDWWLDSEDAAKAHAVDGVIGNVTCSKQLIKKRVDVKKVTTSIFGQDVQTVEKSGCPLID